MATRIYTLFGQYNVSGTLPSLAKRLSVFGKSTTHSWNDRSITSDILTLPIDTLLIFIGFSLGANRVAASLPLWLKEYANPRRRVRLVVAYDPSRLSPEAPGGVEYVPSKVEHCVSYYNPSAVYYGGARLVGSGQIEEVQISNWYHLGVPFMSALHERTFQEVKAVAG